MRYNPILTSLILSIIALSAGSASAQVFNTDNFPLLNTNVKYVEISQYTSLPNGQVVPTQFVSLDQFASTANLNTAVAGFTGQITTLNGQAATFTNEFATLNNQLTTMSNQISQTISLTAAVAAMKDAIPAPGDRFAIRFNAGAANGIVGGGLSASANLDDHIRFSVDYGAARNQNVFSGGLNISFN